MNRINVIFIIICLTTPLAIQQKAYSQNSLLSSVVSSGVGISNNSNYIIAGTIGLPLIGFSKGANFQIQTSVKKKDNNQLPASFELFDNYPNPFNPTTVISYNLPSAQHVTLHVYDILGQLVATLVDKTQNAGSYTIHFDAKYLTSGLYIYRLKAGSYIETKKMMLIK